MNEKYHNDETEIDLIALFHVLLRKWWLILIFAVVGGAAALGITVGLITPQYQSTAMLYVLSKTTSITSMADLQMGGELAEDFMMITKSKPVIDGAIERLETEHEMTFTRKQIQDMLAVNTQATRILVIQVTNADPEAASAVANAIADAAVEQMASITKSDPPSILERAEPGKNPVSPSVQKNTLIGLLLGIVLAMAVVVLQYMLNDNIKTEEDVMKYLGLSTLAVIPVDKRRERKKSKGAKKKYEKQE